MTESKSLETAITEAFQKADSLETPLEARLEFYLGESRKLLPDLEATYDELVARLKSNEADILVPAVGERLPNFLMSDSDGHLVGKSQARDALKPSQVSPAATTQAIQLAHTGTENVLPMITGQPLTARANCSTATMAKISAARWHSSGLQRMLSPQ